MAETRVRIPVAVLRAGRCRGPGGVALVVLAEDGPWWAYVRYPSCPGAPALARMDGLPDPRRHPAGIEWAVAVALLDRRRRR
jgi:hypothetical protein